MTLDKKGIYSIQVSAECVKCGLCVKCCPGLGVDFDSLNRELFGKIPQDPFLGHVIYSYIGCALEPSVRQAGASGGIITAIGSYLLSTGQVDGICVVRASNEDPLPVTRHRNTELPAVCNSRLPSLRRKESFLTPCSRRVG